MSARGGLVARLARSRIYVNAYALVLNQVTSAGLGFLYWMLAARLYGVKVVGVSSAAISTLLLISGVAQLGLNAGMYRFVPRAGRHARKLIVWSYVVTIVAAAVFGVAVMWFLETVKPGWLSLEGMTPAVAVLATVLWSVFTFQDGVLIGLRESVWVLFENFTYNVTKIVLLVAGVWLLHDAGIVGSWFIPTPLVIALVTWVVFAKFLRPSRLAASPDAEPPTLREVAFSVTGDHAGSMVAEAAVRALPILVVAMLGAAENAYFYQAWMVANSITLVSGGMANSYSAEAAGDRRNITEYSWGILRHIATLVVPASLVAGFAAPLILLLFGPQYAREGSTLLRWLALAAAPSAFVVWHLAYARVVGHIRTVVVVQTTRALMLLGLSYVLLPRLGIVGVGIAWLAANVVVAAFGLVDSRSVLWPTSAGPEGQAALGRVLQRGDWRFLLPTPVPRRVALFAEGLLAQSAAAFARETVDGRSPAAIGCDVAVTAGADRDTLRACYEALEPGGACYAEFRAWGPWSARAARARMAAAGFEGVQLYWPAPRASRAQVWFPLEPGVRRLSRPAKRIVADHVRSRPGAAAGSLVIPFVLALGPFPTVCAVGFRPGVGRAPVPASAAFPMLGTAGETSGAPAGNAFAIMRAGGGHIESKVNWLVFAGEPSEVAFVAKSSRSASAAESLRREHSMLRLLDERPRKMRGFVVPRVASWHDDELSPLLVQTALPGEAMSTGLRARPYAGIAERIATALAEMACVRAIASREAWWGRIAAPRMAELAELLGGLVEPAFLDAVEACVSGLGDLPLVLAHNDCTPWNLVLMGERTGLFDWEEADPHGLPGVDVVYCLATAAFVQDGVASTPKAIDTYERLLDPADERGAAFLRSLDSYAGALDVSAEDMSRIRVFTWVWHATNELRAMLAGIPDPQPAILDASVILPLLRREMDEFRATLAPEPGSAEERVVFVAPHLDDAPIACGAGIRRLVDRGVDVAVVTACTEDEEPGVEVSRFAMRNHLAWALPTAPFAARRAEDVAAMRVLGARHLHLGLKDAIYRRDASGELAYPKTVITEPDADDAATFGRALEESLGQVLRECRDGRVVCPAGTGGHVDHILVRDCIERMCDASRIVYYEEYPYVRHEHGTARRRLEELGCRRVTYTPDARGLRARTDAIACYRSQLRGLFPTLRGRVAEVFSARLPLVGRLFANPPCDDACIARVRRIVVQDVAEVGGETYWLAREDAPDPFTARRTATGEG